MKQLTLRVKLLGNNVTETPSSHSHTQHHCNSQQKLHGCPIEPFGHDRKTKERQRVGGLAEGRRQKAGRLAKHLHIQTSNHLKKGVEGRKAVVSRRARRER